MAERLPMGFQGENVGGVGARARGEGGGHEVARSER